MLKIEVEREEDRHWIAEAPALPPVLAYGNTEAEARTHAVSLALRVIADRIDNSETLPEEASAVGLALNSDSGTGSPLAINVSI
jgi:predicted RNase H-like HicB family nuclease